MAGFFIPDIAACEHVKNNWALKCDRLNLSCCYPSCVKAIAAPKSKLGAGSHYYNFTPPNNKPKVCRKALNSGVSCKSIGSLNRDICCRHKPLSS